MTQNIWKHVVSSGLKVAYVNDKQLRNSFKRLKCLAFVPEKDVIKAFKLICENSPDNFEPVLRYFETYYIGDLKENSKTQRKTPIFPIAMWNVFEVIVFIIMADFCTYFYTFSHRFIYFFIQTDILIHTDFLYRI